MHTRPTHESYRRKPKCWNGGAEEQKHPWDSNLQTFVPMINYSAMKNLVWTIKSTQSIRVKYIHKYLHAWTLMWPKETAKKLSPPFFLLFFAFWFLFFVFLWVLSSTELILITNRKDLLRKKTSHWVKAFPGDSKFEIRFLIWEKKNLSLFQQKQYKENTWADWSP